MDIEIESFPIKKRDFPYWSKRLPERISTYLRYSGLVGALEHQVCFFHAVGNAIIPTDELVFFRGLGVPLISHCILLKMADLSSSLCKRLPEGILTYLYHSVDE